jgi:hypothetical protein
MFSLPHNLTKISHAKDWVVFGVLQFSNSFPETKNHVYDLASADAMSVELNCLNGTISLPYPLSNEVIFY